MSSFKASPEFLRELRGLALRWGKIAAERASDEVGANQRMDFSDMERFAAAVAAATFTRPSGKRSWAMERSTTGAFIGGYFGDFEPIVVCSWGSW